MSWKYFRTFQLREALAHVEAGGIAVHETGRLYAGKTAAHLLAGTRGQLMTAAEDVGVDAKYLQLEPRMHFDLFGSPLMMALQKCNEDEEPPARKCRACGCTDDHACPGGCYWIEEDLCSACAEENVKRSRS